MLEQDLIEADFDDLSDAEIMVMLLIPDGMFVSRTRLQYLAFLYRSLYENKSDGPKAQRGLVAPHERVSDAYQNRRDKQDRDQIKDRDDDRIII